MNEVYVVKNILWVVPSKFVQIASTIKQLDDLDTMIVEEVVGRLKAHEVCIQAHQEVDEKKLLLIHEGQKETRSDRMSKSQRTIKQPWRTRKRKPETRTIQVVEEAEIIGIEDIMGKTKLKTPTKARFNAIIAKTTSIMLPNSRTHGEKGIKKQI